MKDPRRSKATFDTVKQWFLFRYSERMGITFLSILIILLTTYSVYLSQLEVSEKYFVDSSYKEEIDRFFANTKSHELVLQKKEIVKQRAIEYFEFDPNRCSKNDLLKLGINERVANTFMNYRKSGGRFEQPNDLLKVFGLGESKLKELEPFIHISKKKMDTVEMMEVEEPEILIVDLNRATKEDLIQIKGIGEFYSTQILKYRLQLGGFIHLSQLLEVYGFSEEKFMEIANQLEVKDSTVTTININECEAKDLIRHPYVENWNLANSIINYRKQHGEYNELKELNNIKLLDSATFVKLKPYLSIY